MYAGDVQRGHPGPTWLPACPTIRAGSHKQRFSTSQPTAELQPVKTNVHRAVDIPTSAAASIKLELWPLRNPVSSIQSRPLIYADPPNVLTRNDRLNIHLLTAIHLAFLLNCTDFGRIIPPAQPHSQDQPSCGTQFRPNPSALQAMSGFSPDNYPLPPGEDLRLLSHAFCSVLAQLNRFKPRGSGVKRRGGREDKRTAGMQSQAQSCPTLLANAQITTRVTRQEVPRRKC